MKTVVLVHGAWHGAWCWEKVVAGLEARGVRAVATDLPGQGSAGGLQGDAAVVRDAVGAAGGDVVLVGHSYGGAVIGEAASDAATAARTAHLVYLAGFLLDAGQAVLSVSSRDAGSRVGALMRPSADGMATLDTSDPAAVREAFYADCDDADVARAIARLRPQPMASLITPVSGAPWRTIPTTFVICADDNALSAGMQRAMVTACMAAGAGINATTWRTSHSPFLSRPALAVDLLEGLARSPAGSSAP